jgi:hypothetical protein
MIFQNVPDEGYSRNVPDEGYPRMYLMKDVRSRISFIRYVLGYPSPGTFLEYP